MMLTNQRPNKKRKQKEKETSPGRLELPTSRLTVGRANQLRHGDLLWRNQQKIKLIACLFNKYVSVAQLVSASDC
ncbi:hypothetical protein ACN42_g10444 [Penicillium freii]|uniref:Uncharacterized protein n=1 Tax=Penicillium freii TaxID=48697 RepID=A0A101MA11_PENFR|nr:hypothetical protein ACN42_g10444 [Penicillium freii]